MEELNITRRNLPHWTNKDSVYFVTFRVRRKVLSENEKQIAFEHIIDGNGRFYTLHALVVMPDHLHMILECNKSYSLSRVMKGIKGLSAYKINKSRNSRGQLWQQESFDRIIRNEKEYKVKMAYMYYNPFKKELVDDPEKYEWWYLNEVIS